MDKIAEKLKAYIDTHPLDLGEGDCETVLVNCTKPTQNPTNLTLRKLEIISRNWMNSWVLCHWMITMLCSTYAVVSGLLSIAKPS